MGIQLCSLEVLARSKRGKRAIEAVQYVIEEQCKRTHHEIPLRKSDIFGFGEVVHRTDPKV
ncbi:MULTISPECIES: Ger(x)C family spore germination C-terminal domain-containing protein [Bacillaceae]|uniref:Ger(x)C family spore germination C-terminal domain-containing protein n=1 Tax=Bacillaceae TaxID=186817 RepID=UPI002FC64EC6